MNEPLFSPQYFNRVLTRWDWYTAHERCPNDYRTKDDKRTEYHSEEVGNWFGEEEAIIW